jgi:hypothetical protein
MTFPKTFPLAEIRFYITIRTSMLGSVFFGTFYPVQMLICLQVPPAPVNGQPEGNREDTIPQAIPPPVGSVTGPSRVQDLHHFDVAYQGVAPQPIVAVSNSHLSICYRASF